MVTDLTSQNERKLSIPRKEALSFFDSLQQSCSLDANGQARQFSAEASFSRFKSGKDSCKSASVSWPAYDRHADT